jgi:hypothetical protein
MLIPARAIRAFFCSLFILTSSAAVAGFGPRFSLDGVYLQTTDTKSSDIGNSSPGCGSAIVCYVLFQPVPAGQNLLIEHVSCFVQIPAGGQFKLAQLISKKNPSATMDTFRWTAIAPVLTASASDDTYIVNSDVLYPLKAGEVAVMQLFKNVLGVWQANCTISGHLTTP